VIRTPRAWLRPAPPRVRETEETAVPPSVSTTSGQGATFGTCAPAGIETKLGFRRAGRVTGTGSTCSIA
jgi:hypothetical protein